jgi:hypothetical protein
MIQWLMNMKQLASWEVLGGNEVLEENLPQWHFFHRKPYMTWTEIKRGPNRQSYGMASGGNVETLFSAKLDDIAERQNHAGK